ncbi:MAG: hypothetical protein JWO32_2421 [Bacteroidetes bacterium]|nr:hypothetical protein [Bacteroidota bacterium]
MQSNLTNKMALFCLFFFTSIGLLILSINHPIGDFGNYYYGSKMLHEGKNIGFLYTDTHWFNEQIKTYGETDFFENYAPIPPFSLVFYYPLIFLKSATAKLVFNLIGIIFLCFSLIRLLEQEVSLKSKYFISFIVLLFPIYNNLVQGQAYLIVAALLLEIFIACKLKRNMLTGIYVALLFLLKLFPVLILFYFIIKKQYKVVLWSAVFILILLGITCLVVDSSVVYNYYACIVPRLSQNQVIDPFYYGHQSLDIFLKNMFCYDALENPAPVVNLPLLFILIKSVCLAGLVYFGISLVRKGDNFKMYSIFIFVMILLCPYIPSYFLMLLLPFTLTVFSFKNRILLIVIVGLVCNIPLNIVADQPVIIKYFRIILLVIAFLLTIFELREKNNYKLFAVVLAFSFAFVFESFTSSPYSYFIQANGQGIYFDLKVSNNTLIAQRCMGSKDFSDTLNYSDKIMNWVEMNSHPLLTGQKQNIKKILLINNNILFYLSDIHQGVGMYKVHAQRVR